MDEFVLGTSAYFSADHSLMKDIGIGWVRQGFPFPFADRLGGTLTDGYLKAKAQTEAWRNAGFKVMGITPLVGSETYQTASDGTMQPVWQDRSPAWMGPLVSEAFCHRYRDVCAFLAWDLGEMVPLWQIGNEMDAQKFSGPLGLRGSCELIFQGARGLKETDRALIVGTNTAGIDKSYYLYGRLYADPRRAYLDYCGVDQYFGSWQAGGPWTWDKHIAEFHDITGVKLLVNEWGFSSAGEVMTEEEKRHAWEGSYYNVCLFKKWPFGWGKDHTPEGQADYVREAFRVFGLHREKLIGAFFYRWEDQEKCWQCGAVDCPAEIAWGLVDRDGTPKPACAAF